MKFDFRELTIKKQLIILFSMFLVLAVINFIVIHKLKSGIEASRFKVEIAQHLPTQIKTFTGALEKVNATDEQAKKELHQRATSINNRLNTLSDGGIPKGYDEYAEPVSGKAEELLTNAIVIWDSVYTNIDILRFEAYKLDTAVQQVVEIPNNDSLNTTRTEIVSKIISIDNPRVVKAKSFVEDNLSDFSDRTQSVIQSLEQKQENAESIFDYGVLAVVIINLIIIGLVLFAIKKAVLQPVGKLNDVTEKLSQGHFDTSVDFEWKNEISLIAQKINKLATNLRNATDFVKEVGNGNIDKEFKGIDQENVNANSLEGALLNMRAQMKQVEEEEKVRKWSAEGLTKFVDILRSTNDNVTELCDKIISSLVDYTHSNQGGLYLLNEEDEINKHLELVSLYAFNTKKYDQRSYRLGEGLVGQTFLERKTTYLLEVPNDYINITSGLGGANPKSILIVPLQVNEDIFGILELASFQEYQDYEIEFVEKLGESIASTIATVRNNQQTKRLLEESQELTEQMQAQEEEMRQNMEELSATQEEMARKEIEITAQLTAINNSLGTIEYDIEGNITNTNSVFEKAMGYSPGELQGNAFTSIYKDERNIWTELSTGNSLSGNFNFEKNDGADINLNCTFTPISNKSGETYKIIQLVTQFGVAGSSEGNDNADLDHLEHTLRQNLEELEITQEQLNE
ncbi:HAMP domain-containing protein, partial [Fulvivirga sp. RKSG066]|uniref:GAF domain-containing protein n=1 Tax=Fulvivirga aurantia TaxID=2529383 RepID=UPI0012BC40A2